MYQKPPQRKADCHHVVPKTLSMTVGTMNRNEAKMMGITPAWFTLSGR